MPVSQAAQVTAEETEELIKFREEWKREVQKKKAQTSAAAHRPSGSPEASVNSVPPSSQDTQSVPNSSSTSKHVAKHTRSHDNHSVTVSQPLVDNYALPERHAASRDIPGVQFSDSLRAAVEVYADAIRCEQESRLDEALGLYRRAFRMDSNVDKAYHRMETLLVKNTSGVPRHHHKQHSSTSNEGTIEDIIRGIRAVEVSSLSGGKRSSISGVAGTLPGPGTLRAAESPSSTVLGTRPKERIESGILSSLISTWPRPLTFEPEDESEPVHLKTLPDELLVLILRCLDHSTLERFATISRRARIVSLDSSIWRSASVVV